MSVGRYNVEAVCEACGKTFIAKWRDTQRTCGRQCGTDLARQSRVSTHVRTTAMELRIGIDRGTVDHTGLRLELTAEEARAALKKRCAACRGRLLLDTLGAPGEYGVVCFDCARVVGQISAHTLRAVVSPRSQSGRRSAR